MRILYVITTWDHPKNKDGFFRMCESKGFDITASHNPEDFKQYWDLVYISRFYYDPCMFPLAKAIMYGPCNFNLVSGLWLKRNNLSFPSYCCINLLSEWYANVNVEHGGCALRVIQAPFPVQVDKFVPNQKEKSYDCFVYFKQREARLLTVVEDELKRRNMKYKVITYGKYTEDEYIDIIHKSKFGIWLGRHETQGFAMQECLSCDTPLLVWDVTTMFQEFTEENKPYYSDPSNSYKLLATARSYWSDECGIAFTEENDLASRLDDMLVQYNSFHPRQFILRELTPKPCMDRLLDAIRSLSR